MKYIFNGVTLSKMSLLDKKPPLLYHRKPTNESIMKFEGLDFNYVEFDPHEVMKGFTSKWKNTGILQGIVTARTGPMGIKVSTSEGSWALKKISLQKLECFRMLVIST